MKKQRLISLFLSMALFLGSFSFHGLESYATEQDVVVEGTEQETVLEETGTYGNETVMLESQEAEGEENTQQEALTAYHRVFDSAEIGGIETLYGSGATYTGQTDGLLLSYGSARAGVVDRQMGERTNGVFEATIVPQQGVTRVGLILRATAENKKIFVGAENSSNKWFWEYWNEGNQKWSSIFNGPALTVGEEARIKVELLGNQIKLWVNGTQVFSQTLPAAAPMSAGYFGFDKSNGAGSYLVKEIKYTELECASAILYDMETLPEISVEDEIVPFPQIKEGYRIEVVGSEREGVITNDGKITDANIGEKEVVILVEATNENDESDKARRNFTVTVPSKNSLRSEIFRPVETPNEKPVIIPSLQEWYGYEGSFTVNAETKIVINDQAEIDLNSVAENMKADLKEITGLDLSIVKGKATQNSIYIESLLQDEYDTGNEGYFMTTDENGIKIYSHTNTGALYGTVTVEQILWRAKDSKEVPCGVIRDYPNYEIRGVMFDVGRIPHRIQYLEDYIKILTWYKMNEFHLHMNDDFSYNPDGLSTNWNAWTGMHRLESDVYPSLTKKQVYPDNEYFNTVYADPVYSKDEYRKLEQMAGSKGITLLAEFDTPSHATAYIEYAQNNPDNIEWLGPINTTTSTAANNKQMLALNVNHTNATEKQHALNARKFIEELYKDYLDGENPTFTVDTVHVGADEYWDKNDKEAFRDYTNFLANLMKSYGKTARMWGAQYMFPGTTPISPENIVLDVWATYEEDPIARMNEGFRVVNVPQPYLYTTPGRDHKDMVGEEYLYKNWNPLIFNGDSNVVAQPGEPLLLGAKSALWGDEFREGITEADLHERMLRAVAITAEKTWGTQEAQDGYIEYQMAFEDLQEGPGTEISYNIESKTEVVADYDLSDTKEHRGEIFIEDGSGNGYHAKVTGGKLVTIDEKPMIEFDGTTLMTTPLKTLGYPYTISFDILAKEGNTEEAMLFSGYDGQLRAADVNGTVTIKRSFFTQESGYVLPTDKPVTITIVGNFQNTKLYVDKELVKTFHSTDSGVVGEYWSTFVLPLEEIGKNFKGYIGNIKIFNKSFTQETFVNYDNLEEVNVALNQEAYAERFGGTPALNTGNLKRHPAWKATDGDIQDANSYWLSSNNNADYLMVDLAGLHQIHKVKVVWNGEQYARAFKVQVSTDGENFSDVASITENTATENIIEFETVQEARFVKIQGVTRNANFYGIKELEVYEAADLARKEPVITREGIGVTGIFEEYDFENVAIKPELKVYDGDRLLTEKKDYTIVYKNNINAYTLGKEEDGFVEAKAPKAMIKFKGNYSGTENIYFKIMPADFSKAVAEGSLVVDTDKLSVTYKEKKQQMPSVNITYKGKKLKQGKDFYIPEYDQAKSDKNMFVSVGEHDITICGTGNYTGEISAKVIIGEAKTKVPMSKVTVKGVGKVNWKPEGATVADFSVSYKKAELTRAGTEAKAEYLVSYRNNTAIGKGYMVLTGTGEDGNGDGLVFVGTKTVTFQIIGTSMKAVTVTGLKTEYPYAEGREVIPTLEENEEKVKTVTLKDAAGVLEEGKHYTVSYQKNINKGTAVVIFKGLEQGGYTGSKKMTFKIVSAKMSECVAELKGMSADESGTYLVPITKGGTKPEVKVTTKSGKELVEGTDYTVSYKNNTKVGNTATVTVKGKGNYIESQQIFFKVVSKALSDENGVTVVAKDKIANGKPGGWMQKFKVYDANGKALSNKDYDASKVEYILVETMDENGTWTQVNETLSKTSTVSANSVIGIRVTGTGDYAAKEGEVSCVTGTYRILEKGYDIAKASIKIKEQLYTGDEIQILSGEQFVEGQVFLNTPKGKEPLILGENIEVVAGSYEKNINKGTAKVTFKGKEGTRFGGTKTVTFKIASQKTGGFWKYIFDILKW